MAYHKSPKKSQIPIWLIVLCFLAAWPIGLILLFLHLLTEDKIPKAGRNTAIGQLFDNWRSKAKFGAYNSNASVPSGSDSCDTLSERLGRLAHMKNGNALTIIGSVMVFFFGITSLVTFMEYGTFVFSHFSWFLEDFFIPFLCTGIGAGMVMLGRFRRKSINRFRRYLNLIGERTRISVRELADKFPAKEEEVRNAMQRMIEIGLLGDVAYYDYNRDMLVLDGTYQKPVESPPSVQQSEDDESVLLRQIKMVNDAIRHPEISRKIDRIGEITERIFEFQRSHPEESTDLRRFLNYYLPTTLKILKAYAELEKQGVDGENITATMNRVEGMMDMVVEGFEKQLDKLFVGDMMDIASDISVMESMMRGDGLFEDARSVTIQTNSKLQTGV